jgi:uncharacterized protein
VRTQSGEEPLGVLGARRKPFQDSPTPAGNPAAAIALFRLHAYTADPGYQRKAEQTLQLLAGVAGQYGLFVATYAMAGLHFSQPHTQVIVVGHGEAANLLYQQAVVPFSLTKAVLKLDFNKAVPQNLPPVLAQTIPQLPSVREHRTAAILCSGFTCQPPVSEPEMLGRLLQEALLTHRVA